MALFDSYRGAGRHLEAIHWGQTALAAESALPRGYVDDLTLGMAGSFIKLENGDRARSLLAELDDLGSPRVRARALLLGGFSFAQEERWQDAEATFKSISEPNEAADRARLLAALAHEGPRQPRKSPAIAGLLGIVPGLGYAYAGFPQTAIASLVVNGLFFAGTYKAFEGGNAGLGTMLGLMSLGWYGGNVYGSVASAQRRNHKAREDFLVKFELGFRF
jgi:hypothetical protein